MALANSPLPSARKSTLPSSPVDFFQASMTNTSFTPVTAMALTPFALMAAALFRKLGMCMLVQVGVKAPGTANRATFLPLKMSSVVLGLGPSAVITRNVAFGNLSPTLMGMVVSSLVANWLQVLVAQNSVAGGLVEMSLDLDGAVAFDHGEGQF